MFILRHEFLFLLLTAVFFVIRIAVCRREKSKLRKRWSRILWRLVFASSLLLLVGGWANEFVRIANCKKIPVAYQDRYAYAAAEQNAAADAKIGRRDPNHSLATSETKLFWLCDYINDASWGPVPAFVGYGHFSPGDLAVYAGLAFLAALFPWLLAAAAWKAWRRFAKNGSRFKPAGPEAAGVGYQSAARGKEMKP